jgi:serpin B
MKWIRTMNISAWVLAALSLTAVPAAAGGLPLSPLSASAGDQGFALALFQTLSNSQPRTNILVSPLSVYTALMMTAEGARGATQAAMAKILGFVPDLQAAVSAQLADYLAQVEGPSAAATLHLANAIWTGIGTPVDEAFADALQNRYDALVKSLPLRNPAEAVNAWVEAQTRGRIDRIVENIDPRLAMLLLNAAYFKAAWQTPFSAKATSDGPFHLAGGGTQEVAYMTRRGRFDYLADDGVQLISLPYRDPRFRLLVLLPAEERPLPDLVAGLGPRQLADWSQGLKSAEGRISLPRFQLRSEYTLKRPLSTMGMQIAFDDQRADFSGITDIRPFAIGDVKHRCVLKVDEAGSEAAAVTAVEMFGAAPPAGTPFDFRAERPFLCLLEDQSAGRILFMAAVYRPDAPYD